MTSYSLFELNEYIKRVIALNFTEPIWVNCEISQVKEVRGQVYLDLIQHSEDGEQITAQSNAVIWYKSYLFIRKKLGELLPAILTAGTKVLVKVNIEYNERYGMKLVIEDIDPTYTMGQAEINKQKIITKLRNADLIEKNKFTILPQVIQRIAVISSETAAGFADFKHQITENEYGYRIHLDLFPAAMQGQNTEREVCQAVDNILSDGKKYDCIVLIRGGGSKLDLASFDNYNIGHKIASSPLPVLTGIGHEIDSTVADVVAFSALKTPTAVATFIIDRNVQFESDIVEAVLWIKQMAQQKLEYHRLELNQMAQLLLIKPGEIVRNQFLYLDQLQDQIRRSLSFTLKKIESKLTHFEQMIQIVDPSNVLKKGYVLLEKNGKKVTKCAELSINDKVEIIYSEGRAVAKITDIKQKK